MFEEKNTESIILNRMLDRVPNDLDKREGSIIFDTLAPVALELAQMYSDLDRFLEYTFANEETPEVYLVKRASEAGVDKKSATYALKKGVFLDSKGTAVDVPLQSRFSIDGLYFRAIEKISNGMFKMQCETAGNIGNAPIGKIIPLGYIENLASAEISDLIEDGKEDETKLDLFGRYSEKVRHPATSGNANHYTQWALEVPGTGKVKVFPTWNGPGTVKILLTDSDRKVPSDELLKQVAAHIEELRPIGATVTVKAAIEKPINLTAKVVLADGVMAAQIHEQFKTILESYLKDCTFSIPYVSVAKVGNFLLNIPGVLDYSDLKINDSSGNLVLGDEEIPVIKTISLGV